MVNMASVLEKNIFNIEDYYYSILCPVRLFPIFLGRPVTDIWNDSYPYNEKQIEAFKW